MLDLGQLERFPERKNGLVEELFLCILSSQLEVEHRELPMQRQARVLDVRGSGDRLVGAGGHLIADAAPQVRLPGRAEGHLELVAGARARAAGARGERHGRVQL